MMALTVSKVCCRNIACIHVSADSSVELAAMRSDHLPSTDTLHCILNVRVVPAFQGYVAAGQPKEPSYSRGRAGENAVMGVAKATKWLKE